MCVLVNVRFDLVMDSILAKKFRNAAYAKYPKKGALSNVFEEAIRTWINKNRHHKFSNKSKKS